MRAGTGAIAHPLVTCGAFKLRSSWRRGVETTEVLPARTSTGEQRRIGSVDVRARTSPEENNLLIRVQSVACPYALPKRYEQLMQDLVPAGCLALRLLKPVAQLNQLRGESGGEASAWAWVGREYRGSCERHARAVKEGVYSRASNLTEECVCTSNGENDSSLAGMNDSSLANSSPACAALACRGVRRRAAGSWQSRRPSLGRVRRKRRVGPPEHCSSRGPTHTVGQQTRSIASAGEEHWLASSGTDWLVVHGLRPLRELASRVLTR